MLSTDFFSMVNKTKNLIFPRLDKDFQFYDRYLKIEEIIKEESFVKTPETQTKKPIFVCSEYKSRIKELVFGLKFFQEKSIAEAFSLLIEKKVDYFGLPKPDLIISTPADPQRILIRGYHPPEEICKKLSKDLNVDYISILEKSKTTKSQLDLEGVNRLKNLKNLFKVKENFQHSIEGDSKVVWVVDDITTTGSTLIESYNVLESFNSKNKYFLIAVAGSR
jgi:ComF family protein